MELLALSRCGNRIITSLLCLALSGNEGEPTTETRRYILSLAQTNMSCRARHRLLKRQPLKKKGQYEITPLVNIDPSSPAWCGLQSVLQACFVIFTSGAGRSRGEDLRRGGADGAQTGGRGTGLPNNSRGK